MEDDFHCMSVVVRHDGKTATEIVADMRRAPWSTCPGAASRLEQFFKGVALKEFSEMGEKKFNCTHLYDMAILAASHAQDESQTIYDITISDEENKERVAIIQRNGETLLSWIESDFKIVKPEVAQGIRLDKLRSWIDTLEPEMKEPARLLQWGNMLANGRSIPLKDQSDATKMPPNCYSFQPDRALEAIRVGEIKDFSQNADQPLDQFKTVI